MNTAEIKTKTAVLLIGFGGPTNLEQVRPFLNSVLSHGASIPSERFLEVLKHYELVNGVSPYNTSTYKQRDALQKWLKEQGSDVQVGVGFKHSSPSFKDVFEKLKKSEIKRVVGFVLSSFRSHSSFEKYVERLEEGQKGAGASGIQTIYTGPFYEHPLFVEAQADRVQDMMIGADVDISKTLVVFTAHSIPLEQSEKSGYAKQFEHCASLVAGKLKLPNWAVAYQSRSGDPEEPWLGPDIRRVAFRITAKLVPNLLLVPIGFLCDNVEILHDLDVEVKDVCQFLCVRYLRTEAVNDHPKFIEMMGRQVLEKLDSGTAVG